MQRRSHSVGGGNELPKGLAHPRAACSTQCTIAEISFYRKQVDHDRLFSRAAALLTVEQWDDMCGLPLVGDRQRPPYPGGSCRQLLPWLSGRRQELARNRRLHHDHRARRGVARTFMASPGRRGRCRESRPQRDGDRRPTRRGGGRSRRRYHRHTESACNASSGSGTGGPERRQGTVTPITEHRVGMRRLVEVSSKDMGTWRHPSAPSLESAMDSFWGGLA